MVREREEKEKVGIGRMGDKRGDDTGLKEEGKTR